MKIVCPKNTSKLARASTSEKFLFCRQCLPREDAYLHFPLKMQFSLHNLKEFNMCNNDVIFFLIIIIISIIIIIIVIIIIITIIITIIIIIIIYNKNQRKETTFRGHPGFIFKSKSQILNYLIKLPKISLQIRNFDLTDFVFGVLQLSKWTIPYFCRTKHKRSLSA